MEIIIHDYLGGPNVISRILIGRKQEIREREREDVLTKSRGWRNVKDSL